MMRLLVISNYYPPFDLGGLEQNAAEVVAALQARGHAVHVLTSRHGSTAGGPHLDRALHLISADPIHYHPHYALTARAHERGNTRVLAAAIAKSTPDVVFIWGMWNLSRALARHAERLCGNRVVYYIASPWPTDVDAHTAYWNAPALRSSRRGPKRCAVIVARALLRGNPGPLPEFPHVLCVSDFMRRYMAERVGVPPARLQVVHNGIDIRRFAPQPRERREAGLQLLYSGGLAEHKGVHVAVEALGHLVHSLGVRDVHLTLLGSGHPEYVKRLHDRVTALGVDDFVTFQQRVDREQLPDLLVHFDVLLFPSVWDEPLARSVQEAMACGLVVIGTNTGGTPEILIDGETGLCVAPNDARALAAKVATVATDAGLRAQLCHNGRRLVEDRFTLDGMVQQIEKYLESVAASKPSAGTICRRS